MRFNSIGLVGLYGSLQLLACSSDNSGGSNNATGGSAANANLFNHIPGGCNVLFMDGHVEFVKWDNIGGDFPMNSTGVLLNSPGQDR